MEQPYTTGKPGSVIRLILFRKSSRFHETGNLGDVLGEKYRIVDQLFMALVAVRGCPLFQLPFIVIEYRRTNGPRSICGSTEETFGDITMLGGVGAAFERRLGIVAVAMKPAPADCALFTRFYLHTVSNIIPITKFRVSYAVTIHQRIICYLYGNCQGTFAG